MADLGTLVTIAGQVFNLLQCPLIQEMKVFKSNLRNLKKTISTINNVLLDADRKIELSHEEQDWIERLKDALYDADDLFDQYLTLAEQKQLNKDARRAKKFFNKVRCFFSSRNPIMVAYNTSEEINSIRQKLDAAASDHQKFGWSNQKKFGFEVHSQAIRQRKPETCGYIHAPDVIGRDDDLKSILGRLLDCNTEHDVCFLAIVGIGGLGKTTLAQLVYNDERVKKQFPVRLWACISDQDGVKFDEKTILCKILESATGHKPDNGSSLHSVQSKFLELLEGINYFLVLDDVWNEDRSKWLDLGKFFREGGAERRILVTTRSKETARIIADDCSFELGGLSSENSWKLFKMTAFDLSDNDLPEFVETGKKIVKKCSNVPLAIKVLGSLLYNQDINKWRSFVENGVAGIGYGENQIMSILKASYHNLEPSLKSCFSYCALFPKDFRIEKEMLISLWMAQGYIVPFDRGQRIENAAEEHFLILLRRCFFQDVWTNEDGDVESFKIHGLMHDVAQEVAGKEICVATPSTSNFGDRVRHLFVASSLGESSFTKSNLRTYFGEGLTISMDTIVKKWVVVRALDLEYSPVEILPDSIDRLLHLRYLNLSRNVHLEELPDSITRLYNLQTLNLSYCWEFKEWPQEFCNLVRLRHLDIKGCKKLTYMPWGIDKLTCLCVLTSFIIADENPSGMRHVGQLEDLKALVNLKGRIHILFPENATSAMGYEGDGGCLEGAECLNAVRISFPSEWREHDDKNRVSKDEALMERLQPHQNLRVLELHDYAGAKIPWWGRIEDNWANYRFLPNLVKIELRFCSGLQQLPLLSKLQHLKYLELSNMGGLEYIEDSSYAAAGSSRSKEAHIKFFPSLESLSIHNLHKLKGWWGSRVGLADSSSNTSHIQQPFPRLSVLYISWCPDLKLFPPCPSLRTLHLDWINEALRIATSENTVNSPLGFEVKLDSIGCLKWLPAGRLTSIEIFWDHKVECLSEVEEVFKSCSSSLRSLTIYGCSELRSLSGGLKHLTALQSLNIENCEVLKLEEEGYDNHMPWRALQHNLCSLSLHDAGDMHILPKGMQYLTTLEHLSIGDFYNLKALPEWICCLSSLKSLFISRCHSLKSLPEAMRDLSSLQELRITKCRVLYETCQELRGNDWPKIQHIPDISLCDS